MKTFGHSGGLGDIIYSLPVVKTVCERLNTKAIFYVKRYNHYNNICDNYETILPLLETLPYIYKVRPFPGEYPVCEWNGMDLDYNLDNFRKSLNVFEHHLIQCHFAGVDVLLSNTWSNPWLQEEGYHDQNYILINRTNRYRNEKSDWKNLMDQHKDELFLFVGLRSEYDDFIRQYKVDVTYKETKNLLQVLQTVRLSKEVWCNQSVVLTLAQASGKKIKLELADNHYKTVCLGNEILI